MVGALSCLASPCTVPGPICLTLPTCGAVSLGSTPAALIGGVVAADALFPRDDERPIERSALAWVGHGAIAATTLVVGVVLVPVAGFAGASGAAALGFPVGGGGGSLVPAPAAYVGAGIGAAAALLVIGSVGAAASAVLYAMSSE